MEQKSNIAIIIADKIANNYTNNLYNILRANQNEYEYTNEILRRYNENKPSTERLINNGIDQYYHRKTSYEAAQFGHISGLSVQFLGFCKEFFNDFWKYSIKKNPEFALQESIADLKSNWHGYKLGLNNPIPAEQNPKFTENDSATMKILKQLKGEK